MPVLLLHIICDDVILAEFYLNRSNDTVGARKLQLSWLAEGGQLREFLATVKHAHTHTHTHTCVPAHTLSLSYYVNCVTGRWFKHNKQQIRYSSFLGKKRLYARKFISMFWLGCTDLTSHPGGSLFLISFLCLKTSPWVQTEHWTVMGQRVLITPTSQPLSAQRIAFLILQFFSQCQF